MVNKINLIFAMVLVLLSSSVYAYDILAKKTDYNNYNQIADTEDLRYIATNFSVITSGTIDTVSLYTQNIGNFDEVGINVTIYGGTSSPDMDDVIFQTGYVPGSDFNDASYDWTNFTGTSFRAIVSGEALFIGVRANDTGTHDVRNIRWALSSTNATKHTEYYDATYSTTNAERQHNFIIWAGPPPAPDPVADNINLSTPEPNTYFYTDTNTMQINLTYNSTTDFSGANFTLYINDVLNETKTGSSGVDQSISFSKTFAEGNYTYYINGTVWNDDNTYNDSEATGEYSFIIDTSAPSLTTNYLNHSVFIGNITGSFNFSDNIGLHSINLSIDGTPLFNVTGINDVTYNYSLSKPLSSFSFGWHNLTVYYADGHTAKKLKSPKDYNPSNGVFNDYIKYTFTPPYKEATIKIKGTPGSIFDNFDTEEKKDRFNIVYKPNVPGPSYTFRVETTEPIYIYNNPQYGGDWIVTGEHWLDFNIPGQPALNVQITKINDYEADIIVGGVNPALTEIVFNSVGDLNDVTETYAFFYGNLTHAYTSRVIVGDSQTIILNITTGDNITTGANLFYNGSLKSASKNSLAGYDLYTATFTTPGFSEANKTFNISWNYSLTGPSNSYKDHINATNDAYNLLMDNCSNYHTHALNISFIDLADYKSIGVDLTYQATGDSDYYFYSNDTANLSLCIYPGWANQSDTLAIQYESTDTYYYNSDINLSNITQTLTLYVQDTSGVTTFTVLDDSTGATIEGAYMTMYRRINGTFQVIQSKYSDITGRVQFGHDSSAEYQFFLSKSGYEPYDFILNPIIFDSYDVLMTPTFSSNTTWDYDRIGLNYDPEIYYNDQINNFTFFIHSPYAELISYAYTLTYPGGTSSNSGTSPVGEQLTSSLNITGATVSDKVYLTYRYETEKSGNRTFNYEYEIIFTGNNTMFGNRNQTYGMGLFERLFIAVFFVFLAVGIATLVGHPLPGLGLGLILYGYFVYIGFLPIWTVLITMAIGLIFLGARPEG